MPRQRRGSIVVPPEIESIALLSRTPVSDDAKAGIDQLLTGNIDWESLLAIAAAWEVEPVVLHNIRTHFTGLVPTAYRQAMVDRERSVRSIALTRALITLELVNGLSDTGIKPIVLKGPALAVMAYDDASLRTYSDIDLLLSRDDMRRAKNWLINRGYEPLYDESVEPDLIRDQHALELSDSRNKVELHWTLLSRHLGINIGFDELKNAAVRIQLGESSIEALAPHHLLLFISAHGTKHQWINPRWICDVAQLTDRLSSEQIDAVLELAGETHTRRILAFALRVARDVLGYEIPTPFTGRLVPESQTTPLVNVVVHRFFQNHPAIASRPWMYRLNPNLAAVTYWALARERIADRLAPFAILLARRLSKERGA